MQTFNIADHEPSLLPKGEWSLAWADEFDAPELDRAKWSFRRHLFHREHPCWIEDEGLDFEDSCIIFKKIEREGLRYSCQLQTGENWYDRPSDKADWCVAKFSQPKFLHKYGYYEARVKLQRGSDWWSAFWLQSPNIGTLPDPGRAGIEVDIMESFLGGTYIPHYIHYNGYGADYAWETTLEPKRWARGEDAIHVDDGFHRFGCLWDETGYTFYVDGVQSGRKLTSAVSHTEQFILIGTECIGYRRSAPAVHDGIVQPGVPDDKFYVDYIRVFDKVP